MAKVKEPEFGTPDVENPMWTEDDFAQAVPFTEVARQMGWKITGRPRKVVTKVPTNLRLDPEIVAYFKSGGEGWQTRINAVLAKHVKAANAAATRKKKAS